MPVDLSLPNRLRLNFNKPSRKTFSEPEISFNISQNDLSLECSPRLEMFSDNQTKNFCFEKLMRIKNLRWRYFITEVVFKEVSIFSFLILLIQAQTYIHHSIYCEMDNSNIPLVIYTICRDMFFSLSYYVLFAYYAFNLCWPRVADDKIVILGYFVSITVYLLKIYNFDPYDNNFDIYAALLFCQGFRVIIVEKRQLCLRKNIKTRIFPLFFLLGFCLLFHNYGMKNNFIPYIKAFTVDFVNSSLLGSFIFQMFLFLYFRVYYKIFFFILMMYSEMKNDTKIEKSCLVMFSKYFLMDAVCSSTPTAIIGNLNSVETWLGFFNFLYQVLVLYDQNFDLLRNLRFLFLKLCKKEPPKLNQQEQFVKEILSMSLNHVLLIIFHQLIIWFSFRKCMDRFSLVRNCDFQLKEFVELRIENILLLFIFVFLVAVALATKKIEPLRLEWELESYRFLLRYIIMLCCILLLIIICNIISVFIILK